MKASSDAWGGGTIMETADKLVNIDEAARRGV
jgi:hypothetical protein